ncbi:Two-component sensor histidine kinase, contains HisKA and HATPase domains [Sulfitobacter brevis]|uniref:histidine kinase n=1 Tax=Sulfitobacter brevis TaxID=74348 RepID=A0A1I1XX23_9RHOB|nr:Two-component sensor histidine kinase, contains HisKA and HATPase domains [Sulfitobacter brevis]
MRGLELRVLFFLSLALLPIGLIAVVQTQQITEQSKLNAELSLLAVTEQASGAERQVLQEAFGAAEALGSIIRIRRDSPDCSAFLRDYRDASNVYTLVGFIRADGIMECSSEEKEFDFTENDSFHLSVESQQRRATTFRSGTVSQRPVTVVNTPVFDQGELIGVMSISIPFETFKKVSEPALSLTPLAMMTFNQNGDILTTERGYAVVEKELPKDVALSVFTGDETKVFRAASKGGQERAYAVLPIVPNTVFALSVWPSDTPFLQTPLSSRIGLLLPVLMWLASLIVAFWALNRLAITHIRKLGRQMRRFAINRTLPRDTLNPSVPTELMEMESAFIGMAESILRDEATLEDSLREKNILLKEVHHRVKNNLQLISSIMNMQIRQASTADARFVLRRLQERILGLATVHKNLYQNDDLVRVDASVLLHEVVNQLLSVGLAPGSDVKVHQHYDKISVDADDAAPLTLLVSEALTNALKYVSRDPERESDITVNLGYDSPENAILIVKNAVGKDHTEPGTGLGSRLILAFTRQLNGQIEVEETETDYTLTVKFPVPQRGKEIRDY